MKKKTIYLKDYRYLVSRLRKARREAGLRQDEVAKLMEVTQSNISKIESAQIRLDPIQLREFARIYRKKINYFYP